MEYTDRHVDLMARALASMETDEEWADATVSDDEYRSSMKGQAEEVFKHPHFVAIVSEIEASALREAAEVLLRMADKKEDDD